MVSAAIGVEGQTWSFPDRDKDVDCPCPKKENARGRTLGTSEGGMLERERECELL